MSANGFRFSFVAIVVPARASHVGMGGRSDLAGLFNVRLAKYSRLLDFVVESRRFNCCVIFRRTGVELLDEWVDGVGDAAVPNDLFFMRIGEMKRRCSGLFSGRWFSMILPS